VAGYVITTAPPVPAAAPRGPPRCGAAAQ
jgi:hypothetical protein